MNRRRWLVGGWLALALLAALGAARLRFDVEVLNLLPADLPVVRGLKLYQENFANARELLLTVRAEEPAAAEAAARALAVALRAETNLVHGATWQAPWLEHPGDAAELSAYLWFNQPPEVFQSLAQRLAPGNLTDELATAREALALSLSPSEIARRAYDPLDLTAPPPALAESSALGGAAGQFASADGKFRVVFVPARGQLAGYRECAAFLEAVRGVEAALRAEGAIPPEARVRYTGRPAFVAEIAGGMERDMIGSVFGTLALVAGMFWLAHRRWRPLLWLVALLAVILGATTALGGLIFGTVSVVSMGFAAILLGLAADYALVLYQEWRAEPGRAVADIRREHTPAIVWSAATTAGAFAMLNFGGLPGLGQLGTLVAVGTVVAAAVMLTSYLPPLARALRGSRGNETLAERNARDPERGKISEPSDRPLTLSLSPEGREGKATVASPGVTSSHPAPFLSPARSGGEDQGEGAVSRRGNFPALVVTLVLLIISGFVLFLRPPAFDHSADALRPARSSAHDALVEMTTELGRTREPLWLLAHGTEERAVADQLARAQVILARATSNRVIESAFVPLALWPDTTAQSVNRAAVRELVARRAEIESTILAAGFTTNALALTGRVLDAWESAAAVPAVFWPTNAVSRWTFNQFTARTVDGWLALGLVYPAANGTRADLVALADELARAGVPLSGWELLGHTIFTRVARDFWFVLGPMVVVILGGAWLAFRSAREVLLSFAALGFAALLLFAVMSVCGWSWNLLNLMALPLLLGAGIDYSLHIQLALRRHGGDAARVRATTGRALWLCAGTTCAAFGSLAFSNNAGLASLGQVCAAGVACAAFTANVLLPAWWSWGAGTVAPPSTPQTPSRFYGPAGWRLALALTRRLPVAVLTALSRGALALYWHAARTRRDVVIANLTPVVGGERAPAVARQLFDEFARKLADLWRYEAGAPVNDRFGPMTGLEHIEAARAGGRGVLLVTPHLGNWELGAPLLAARGVKLLVITLAEPGRGLTELRQASRARHGIETLVVGADPFAFVEVIKRLEAGAVVALLVDRPAVGAVEVELFGRPFLASIAAAELARASGCAVVPVCVLREAAVYCARALPHLPYDRRALGDRAARIAFTREILRAFEPWIRQHPEQWFHFVPVWPRA
jgi:lauroyl/myristoyl acyltransferase/predicted exporter